MADPVFQMPLEVEVDIGDIEVVAEVPTFEVTAEREE